MTQRHEKKHNSTAQNGMAALHGDKAEMHGTTAQNDTTAPQNSMKRHDGTTKMHDSTQARAHTPAPQDTPAHTRNDSTAQRHNRKKRHT